MPGSASLQSNFWELPGPAGAGWAEAPGGEAGGWRKKESATAACGARHAYGDGRGPPSRKRRSPRTEGLAAAAWEIPGGIQKGRSETGGEVGR